MQALPDQEGNDQGDGDGGADDGQGRGAHLGDLRQVQSEAQQDNRVLEDLFGGEGNAGLEAFPVVQARGYQHADQDGEHRSPHQGKDAAQQIAGDGQDEAEQQARPDSFDSIHGILSLF